MTGPNREIERQALGLLEDAFEQPSALRDAWIKAQTHISAAARCRALSLLTTSVSGNRELETGGAANLIVDDAPPQRVGEYKIGKQLGRGGMGAVYLAQRDSGDFAHRTAVKFIRPGVLSEALIHRFTRERQVLASLKHPHIAQLYDGGATDDGTPYFMMEYVDGVSIPRWLGAAQRSLSNRLRLFGQVCDAVEFAHQNLIIHRDLTPSNVLVTDDGDAKLIDFGIAKPPSNEGEEAHSSSISPLSLTPGFAAPERAQSRATNTLTDIYSLGKILETLLDGFGEQELDAIAAKATMEEPEQRYSTVRALSLEVKRYQNGFAVSAYSQSARYRFSKFLKRQRLPVAAAAFAVVSLVGALITTSLAYQRAEVERIKAAERFEDVRDLAKFQLFELYDSLSRVAGNTQARGDLANEAQGYLKTLASDPNAPPGVQLDTAAGYVRLARIMGVPARPSLGEPGLATEHLNEAERLLNAYTAAGNPRSEVYYATKADMHAARSLIRIHEDMTMDKASLDLADGAAALVAVGADARGAAWHRARRLLYHSEAEFADMSSKPGDLMRIAQILRENAKTWPRAVLPVRDAELDLALADHMEGLAAYVAGDHDIAIDRFGTADLAFAALDQKRFNDPVVLYLQAWNNYIGYGSAAQRTDTSVMKRFIDGSQAVTDRLKTLEERDAMVKSMDSRLREARAQYLARIGDFEGALQVQNDILQHYRDQMAKTGGRRHVFNVAYSQIVLGFLRRDTGDLPGACGDLQEANAMLAPIHARQSLPSFMARAGDQLPLRIALCKEGKDIGRQNTVFEAEDWSPPQASSQPQTP
ncbi:MAG: serine/threonine-protein kinase [Pseudomonadota bacterium]